jgi:hypothetical protein
MPFNQEKTELRYQQQAKKSLARKRTIRELQRAILEKNAQLKNTAQAMEIIQYDLEAEQGRTRLLKNKLVERDSRIEYYRGWRYKWSIAGPYIVMGLLTGAALGFLSMVH